MEHEYTLSGFIDNSLVNTPQNFQSILDAFKNNSSGFFYTTLVYGIITGILGLLLVIQLWVMPANDKFVLKGSIYLVIGTVARTAGSIWIFCEYQNHMDVDKKVKRPYIFGSTATEISLEIPVFMYLIVMYSFLFSTYKLYCMLK